jgi:quinol monooxygenase YgiN
MFKHALLGFMSLFLVMGVFAQGMKMEAKKGAHVTVVITHEVKNYASWRKGYDADESNRNKAGFRVSGVYADLKNPNMVTVIGEFPSAAAAEAFAASPKLKEAMEKSGVIGKPEVKILTVAPK